MKESDLMGVIEGASATKKKAACSRRATTSSISFKTSKT
jgi:hypothetical protein